MAYKKSCQITFDAMGRYGVEGVLSEPSIGPIGFVWRTVDLEALRWADIRGKKSYKISKNIVRNVKRGTLIPVAPYHSAENHKYR